MKCTANLVLLILILVVCQSSSPGQAASKSPSTPSATFASERQNVQFLVGSFTTSVSMPASPSMPKGASGKGTSVITWALDSMYLSLEEESVNSLFGRYKGHGMLGFDVPSQQFVLSMFNNFGDHPTYHGTFVGDTLVLQTRVPSPRGTFDQKLLWYKDGNNVKLQVSNDFGKGFLPVLEQTATPASTMSK